MIANGVLYAVLIIIAQRLPPQVPPQPVPPQQVPLQQVPLQQVPLQQPLRRQNPLQRQQKPHQLTVQHVPASEAE